MNEENISMFESEIELLKSLDHPNIVKVYEYYEDDHYFYIITDYVDGGELFDEIIKRKNLSEIDAVALINSLLSSISYCHSR